MLEAYAKGFLGLLIGLVGLIVILVGLSGNGYLVIVGIALLIWGGYFWYVSANTVRTVK